MMKTKRGARNPSALLIPILAFFLTIALLVPMARSADRDLFVGTMPNDDTYNLGGIQRFDGVTGAYLGYFVTPGAGGLSAPLFFIFGPDRNLYISAGASVKRYNGTTGAYLGDFVTFGTEGSTYAAGLAFGPDGNLYVAWWSQPGGWKVARYTPGGAYIDDFVPSANGGTSWVGDLAFGPNGNLYVMDGANGIVRFNGTTGTPLGLLVPIPTGTPYCMVFGPDGNLYVALAPYTVKRYSGTTGADLGTIYSFWPAGVDFGPDGNLYVARRYVNMGGRVDRYNGVNGTYIGQFAVPSGVSTELGIRWSPPFNPDLLAPTASPAQSPAAQGMGWNNSDVTVTWNWADNPGGSGIDPANCTASSASSGEGVITLNAACKDLAGNTGTATYSVKVD